MYYGVELKVVLGGFESGYVKFQRLTEHSFIVSEEEKHFNQTSNQLS